MENVRRTSPKTKTKKQKTKTKTKTKTITKTKMKIKTKMRMKTNSLNDKWNNIPHQTQTEINGRGPCEPSLTS